MPGSVVRDLIFAGKFDDAQLAIDSKRSSEGESREIQQLSEQLAMARQAESSIIDADGQAAMLASKRTQGGAVAPTAAAPQKTTVEDIALAQAADLFQKGFQAEQQGNFDEAEGYYSDVLKLFPNSEDARRRILAIESKKQDALDASSSPMTLAKDEVILKIAPLYDKGVHEFNQGNYGAAQAHFEKVLAMAPDHKPSRNYLEQCYAKANPAQPASQDETLLAQAPAGEDPWKDSSIPAPAEEVEPILSEITQESVSIKSEPVRVSQVNPIPLEAVEPPVEAIPQASEPAASPVVPDSVDGEVNDLVETGQRVFNEKGDILTAYDLWTQALQKDPNNVPAKEFIDKYAAEYAEARQKAESNARISGVDEQVEAALNRKMNPMQPRENVSISSVLAMIASETNLDIVSGEGVDGSINVLAASDMTYREFMDNVLTLNGYNWNREPGTNRIIVTREVVTKRFPLTEEQYQALKRLAMGATGGKETDDFSDALREVILGKVDAKSVDAPVPGRKFILSKHLMELVVRDSKHNVELVEQFLQLYNAGSIQMQDKPLVVETFRLPKVGGENLARIISLRLFGDAEFKSNFRDNEPYILYDNKTNILIIRQDPEKLDLAKRLMKDSKFMAAVTDREVKARKYTVVSQEDLRTDTPDAIKRRKSQVEFTAKVFQKLLYGSKTVDEAVAEGRVMYPNPEEGTIDVVDTNENLRKIDDYLAGINDSQASTRTVIVQRRDTVELAYALQDFVLSVNVNQPVGVDLQSAGEGGGGQDIQQDRQSDSSSQNNSMSNISGQSGMQTNPYDYMIPVMVIADIQSKSLIISGRPQDLDRAETLIEKLDVPPDQVEIEVRLVELNYDSTDSMGITMTINNILELDDDDEPGPGFTLADAAMDLVSRPNNPSGSSLSLATVGRTSIDALLNFLSQFTDIRILTAPKVTVESGRMGHVFLGETIPYISGYTTTVPVGSNVPVVQSQVTRSEFGFTLDAMPTVTGDGHIELELQPDLTVPGDRLPIPNPVTGSLDPVGEPSTDTRQATVRVRVKDGSTLVMGGLLRRQINHVEGRTPVFGFIPGLAPLFTEKSDVETTQNLLIMVTARLIPED